MEDYSSQMSTTEQDAALFDAMDLGQEMKNFITNDRIGKYMWAWCRNRMMETAITMQRMTTEQVRQDYSALHANVQFPAELNKLFVEAITTGEQARELLKTRVAAQNPGT